ncbi:DUF2913 family protein [Shewanella surugensis]|uniref:DUF2913 family protein n=1 Tax=Shewanella surugensis TaxID=212020 RepID=A0ABT0LJV8_9GAMM|nr:DUF2913 family protein [Shewanella surugensis]MCL1128002.1 DUF2913 family protein [Shewanella surugensis]
MNETYKDSLNGLVEHSLIHLYLNCDESSRFIPTPKRNQILVQHLKPKIKDPEYSSLKNELKRFIAIGRKTKGDLELKLIEIKKINEDLDQEATNARNLFDVLETLKIKLKIDSRFIRKDESRKPNFIYMYQSDIEKGFDDKGNQIIPLMMLTNPKKTSAIIEVIKNTSLFVVEETEIKGDIVLKSIQ